MHAQKKKVQNKCNNKVFYIVKNINSRLCLVYFELPLTLNTLYICLIYICIIILANFGLLHNFGINARIFYYC